MPQGKNYSEAGNQRWNVGGVQRVLSGGAVEVKSGGEIDVESGGALKIAGTAVSASAAELNKLDGVTASTAELNKLASLGASTADLGATSKLVDSITVVAANDSANTAHVIITLLDPDGNALTEPTLVHVWLSDLTTGVGGSTHTHSTGPAITVGEEILEMITDDSWLALTNASGTLTLVLIDTGAENVTVNAGVPGMGIRGSDTTIAADFTG